MSQYLVPSSLDLRDLTISRMADLVWEGRVPPIDGPLPHCISNAIVESLRVKGRLSTDVLVRILPHLFSVTEADLGSCEVSVEGLSTLLRHPLKALSLYRIKYERYGGHELICASLKSNSPSRWTLRCLNLGGTPFNVCFDFARTLECFPFLETLLIPESQILNNVGLERIVSTLPKLKHLDISRCEAVTDISCISLLEELEVLLLHGLRLDMVADVIEETFRLLPKLKVVDLSDKRSDYVSDSTDERPRVDLALVVWQALKREKGTMWPLLVSLDMAGNALLGVDMEEARGMVHEIVTRHKNLRNLSILDTPLDRVDFSSSLPPSLSVSNSASRVSCLHALSLYWRPDREAFTAHALQAVYYLLQSNYEGFSLEEMKECARLFELSMRFHPRSLSIQMAASACLYHLCKLKRIRRLDPQLVRRCIDRCLDAAQLYPTMTQLQKNVWLTICNDHLLQSCPLDFHRTCSVALESMLMNRDTSVARMTIAIVSIVAPKVSSCDSSLLSDSRYVSFLVDTMRTHLHEITVARDNAAHFALKFTLSALWNLTDECALTCSQIVEHGGVEVAFRVLNECSDNHNIRTKVLGLLNNIAEVPELHSHLLKTEYIERLRDFVLYPTSSPASPSSPLLVPSPPSPPLPPSPPSLRPSPDLPPSSSPRIDVQYFAAGILSNLVTSKTAWRILPTKMDINRTLVDVVSTWPRLTYSMVAYRSFTPFLSLLNRSDCPGAQLWAVWAVEHVCVGGATEAEYLRRLRQEGCVSTLQQLVLPTSLASSHAKRIAARILSTL